MGLSALKRPPGGIGIPEDKSISNLTVDSYYKIGRS